MGREAATFAIAGLYSWLCEAGLSLFDKLEAQKSADLVEG
jgi:hypothetical protein